MKILEKGIAPKNIVKMEEIFDVYTRRKL